MRETLLTTYNGTELKTLISDCIKESLLGFDLGKSKIDEKTKQILTRQETAKLLAISLPTLNSYTQQGLIRAFRIGSSVRYRLDDVFTCLKVINVGKK